MALKEFHEEEFNKKATELFNASELLNDNWEINETNGKVYLSKKKTILMRQAESEGNVVASDDPCVVMPSLDEDPVSIEYHVLFHPSYQVPVLYFRALNLGKYH